MHVPRRRLPTTGTWTAFLDPRRGTIVAEVVTRLEARGLVAQIDWRDPAAALDAVLASAIVAHRDIAPSCSNVSLRERSHAS